MLDLFKHAPTNMALAIDEYGAVQGLVTLIDLLEAIAANNAGAFGKASSFFTRTTSSMISVLTASTGWSSTSTTFRCRPLTTRIPR